MFIEITLSTDESDSQPYTWDGFDVKPRHTYLMGLSDSKEDLLNAMSPERRKNIRKAEKDGLQVIRTEDVKQFRSILDHTIKRQEIALDTRILDALLRSSQLANNRTLYICRDEGCDIAASLVVWDSHRTYYLIGAGTLNIWTAILDAKARANAVFDFEGSMIPQVERYFRGFGGELHTFFAISRHKALGRLIKRFKGS